MKKFTYNLVSRNGIVADKARMSESAAEKKNADPILKEKGAQWTKKETAKQEEKGIEAADDGAQELSIFSVNLRDQSKGQYVVHTCDCKDCDKLRKSREHESKGVYMSLLEVAADLAADLIAKGSTTAEEYMSEIHFAPCVILPHGKVVNGEIIAGSPKAAKPAPVAAPKAQRTRTTKTERDGVKWDAFGGRIGTRMSKINLEVINAGAKGATVLEVAEATKEKPGIVGAQLGWICSHKKLATRKEEGDTFRYFANVKS